MKAIKQPMPKTEEAQQIEDATELHFINIMISVNAKAQANLRRDIKRLRKEERLLINIKKKWNS